MNLTSRQQQVLSAIGEFIRATGAPPTLREIGSALGIRSNNGVNDHLNALERKGYIRRGDMKARNIRLVERDGCCALCGAKREAPDAI